MIVAIRGSPIFYWIDSLMQLFIAIIAIMVAKYGYRAFKIARDRRFLYFSGAFILLSIGLLIFAFLIPGLFIYYKYFVNVDIGMLMNASHILNFVYIFVILMAYMLFVFVYSDVKKLQIITLVSALVFALVIYSFIFSSFIGLNVISLLLLVFILFYVGKNCKIRKNLNSRLVLIMFILIAIAHIAFIFGPKNNNYYIVGHFTQLIGYFGLLILFLRVNYGREKRQIAHCV